MVTEQIAPGERERVLSAVLTEVSRWGIDRFDLAATIERHDLDPDVVALTWPDPASLILDALAHRPGENPPPDTGSLLEDLYQLATGMAALVSAATGPKLHGAHLITDHHLQTVDIRRAAWRARVDSLRVVFERAQARGEVRSGIDSEVVLEMLFAPINMRLLYTAKPVTDEYCRDLAGLVNRSVAA